MRFFFRAALTLGLVAVAGCASDDSGAPSSTACVLTSDCNAGLVCLFRLCTPICRQDRDCPANYRCLTTEAGAGCVAPLASSCDASCPDGTVCATDNECRTDCSGTSKVDCTPDQLCEQAICIGTDAAHDPSVASFAGAGGSSGGAGASGMGAGGAMAGAGGSAGGGAGVSGSAQTGGGAGAAGASGASAGFGGNAGMSGSGGASSGGSMWPDSPTALCSDGTQFVSCASLSGSLATQDGAVRGTIPTFQISTDTLTATDTVTGLEWQRNAVTASMSQSQAIAFCAQQGDGFRLPNMVEALSILDLGRSNPSVDPVVFSMAIDATSTSSIELDGDLVDTDIQHGDMIAVGADSTGAVRCVRGPTISLKPALQPVAGGHSLLDPRTGLIWQITDTINVDWLDALAFCASSTTDGQSWRLPSLKELLTLADYTAQDPAFPANIASNAPAPWIYWTASPAASETGTSAHIVGFDTADSYVLSMSMPLAARCVRGPAP